MPSIRTLLPSDLHDAELISIADKISDSFIVAGQKALLNISDPTQFPMPQNRHSMEHSLATLFDSLPKNELVEASRRFHAQLPRDAAISFLSNAAISHNNVALFSKLNIRSDVELESQLERLSPQFSVVDFKAATQEQQFLGGGLAGFGQSSLRFNLKQLHCIVETGLSSYGSDHVFMQGVQVDAFGNSSATAVQDLGGGWDNGNHENWDDRTLANFDLDYGTGWPRPCTLILAISTRSSSGLVEIMDKIVTKARAEVVKYAATAAGALVGAKIGASVGAIGGPLGIVAGAAVGAVVGAIVGYIIDKIWGWIKSQFYGSKVFTPVALTVDVPFHGGDFGGSLESGSLFTWIGHSGKYQATINALLSWGPASVPVAISRDTDKLDLFHVSSATNIESRSWGEKTNWQWSAWQGVKGGRSTADGPIGVVATNKTTLELLVIGLDGKVWAYKDSFSTFKVPQSWMPILEATFVLGSVVSGVSRADGYVDIFVSGKDGHIWSAAKGPQTSGEWAGWWIVGQGVVVPGTPVAAVSRSANVIDLFVTGLDGKVYSASWGAHTGGQWTDWFGILDQVFSPGVAVTAISRKENQLDLFAVDSAGVVRTAAWAPDANNGAWDGWHAVPDTGSIFTPGTTVAAISRGPEKLDIFAIGTDGRVWTAAKGPHTQGAWVGWWPVGDAVFAQGSVISATTRNPGQIDLFVNGLDGATWSAAWSNDEWNWFAI